jgi:hypothetical protein
MQLFQFTYILILGHLFVWAPFALIDFLFCHGKMFQDGPSLFLVELVAVKNRNAGHQTPGKNFRHNTWRTYYAV